MAYAPDASALGLTYRVTAGAVIELMNAVDPPPSWTCGDRLQSSSALARDKNNSWTSTVCAAADSADLLQSALAISLWPAQSGRIARAGPGHREEPKRFPFSGDPAAERATNPKVKCDSRPQPTIRHV